LHPLAPAAPFVIVQLIAGLKPAWLVTVPLPPPLPATVSGQAVRGSPKVAVTFLVWVTLTVHDPLPLHAPDHPLNGCPELGVAVSVTEVLLS
jgi:hypothetical protein